MAARRRIALLTLGSRGDVQPFVALGEGLLRAGHDVTVVTGPGFEALVRERGLRFAPIRADLYALTRSAEGRALLGRNPCTFVGALRTTVLPMLRRMLDDAWAGARGADLVAYHPKVLAGYHVAERLAVPGVLVALQPGFTPTGAFPTPLLPIPSLGPAANRLSYWVALALITAPYAWMVNRWRRDVLGLPRRGFLASELVREGRPVPTLGAWSRHVVPIPPDWPVAAPVTGFWFSERRADWSPPPALAEFLATGPPPIYVGFGSMVGPAPEQLAATVLRALAASGQRAILASGWGGLAATDVPARVLAIKAVPHDWLFERVAAVVHHGGAGTTAAGLRAGRPTLVCPFLADQPFWGRRIQALGVGPRPVPIRRLTTERLAGALRQLDGDSVMRRRAASLGERIGDEDGVARALEVVESLA